MIIINEFSRELLSKTRFLHKIILFGSVSKGTARINSDMDIALITREKTVKQEMVVNEITDLILEKFGRKLQVHFFTKEEFETKESSLIEEIKRDGIDILSLKEN